MDLFRQFGYQLGLFSSAPMNRWVVELDRTALARIPRCGMDRTLTDESVAAGGSGDRVSNGRWMPQALAQPAATPAQPRTRDSR
jgi:hypothetical protein